MEKQTLTPLNNIFLHKVRTTFVKFITEAKDFCVFFDGQYKKLGWDIIVANDWGTWDIQFNKARLRDNNIDEILDEIDGEDIESED